MSVSAGNLDALIGFSGPASDLYGVDVDSATTTGTVLAQSVGSATVAVTGSSAPGIVSGAGETFTITSVDDSNNSATFVFSQGGVSLPVVEYILAYSSSAIMFSSTLPLLVTEQIDEGLYPTLSAGTDLFSTSALSAGTTVTLNGTSTYTASLSPTTTTPTTPTTPTTTIPTTTTPTTTTPTTTTPTTTTPTTTTPTTTTPTTTTPTTTTPTTTTTTTPTPTTPTTTTTTPVNLSSTQASVTGADGQTLVLDFNNALLAQQAQLQLTPVSAAIAAGTTIAATLGGASVPNIPSGDSGLAEVETGGAWAVPNGYTTLIDVAPDAVSLISAASGNQLIIDAGTGDLTYAALQGVETIYAGAGNTTAFGIGSSLEFFGGSGAATIIGGSNGNTVTGGTGTELVFGDSSLDYLGGPGNATIIGGNLGNTVTGGSGSLLIFASSSMTYTGTGGAATVIGGGGALTANLGMAGGVAYGGISGGNNLSTGSGTAQSVLVGAGNGDLLTASGSGADVLVAGGGNETINGSLATGNLVIFGGPGADVMSGGAGNDLFVIEPGNETLTGGGGTNSYVFTDFGPTARTDIITDFDPNHDAIGLYGYGAEPGADNAALASAKTANGTTTVTLTDGTSIILTGAPTLHAYNFF